MTIRQAIFVLFLLAIPGLLLAQSNPTYENVTLQKGDGWKYSNVSVQLADDGYSVIIVRADGASLNVPLKDVSYILDADGKNISWQVIPPGQENKVKPFDEFAGADEPDPTNFRMKFEPPLPPNLFQIMVSGGVGYGQNLGSFYDDLDPGVLFYGDARINISPLVYLKLAYRNQKMLDENLSVYLDENDNHISNIHVTVDARQYLVTFGFLNQPHTKNKLRGYVEVGAGWVNHLAKATLESQTETIGEGRVMFVAGAGLLLPLNKTLGLDCGITFLTKLFNGSESEGWGMLVDGHLGFTLSFGGES